VEVDIDPTLRKAVAAGDVLFVFARSTDGAGPPLAVQRVAAGDWPVRLRLSDADSPMPAGKLSSVAQVVVHARVSKSGNAQGANGDLEADPVTVDTRAHEPVHLLITRSRP
jgi:cytochrome c-type biogenesis protein CcmH